MHKFSKATLTGICFLVIMEGAFFLNAFMPDKKFSESENRMLQEAPVLDYDQYLDGRFETKFEKYADDQFVFRDGFIKVKTSFDVSKGVVESNGIYKCKDDYLIQQVTVPTKRRLENVEEALASFKKSNPTLRMNFLLAPTAGNILADKLPMAVELADQNKYMDEFLASVEESGYNVIDVREQLRNIKDDQQIYYRTDHHWTSEGAYEAYKQLIPVLGFEDVIEYEPVTVKTDFKGTLYSNSGFTNGTNDHIDIMMPVDKENHKDSVIDFQDDSDKTTEFYKLDNLETKDAYSVFGGSNYPIYSIKTPIKSSKRLLVLKDSYANCMIPLLAQYYREIIVVDPRYYFESLDDLIQVEGITDVLFLYNADTFFGDDNLAMMLNDSVTKK